MSINQNIKDQIKGLLIGPEGGLSPEEIELLINNKYMKPINFGKNTLKVDTACATGLAIVKYEKIF